MFDFSASPLLPVVSPLPAMPLANMGNAAETADLAPTQPLITDFASLLAGQSAPDETPIAPPAPGNTLPIGGKTLPVPAMGRARPAVPAQTLTAKTSGEQAQPETSARPENKVEAKAEEALEGWETGKPEATGLPLADMAMLTAIFAAPDRLTTNTSPERVVEGFQPPSNTAPHTPAQIAAPLDAAQKAVALAQTAQVELLPAKSQPIAGAASNAEAPKGVFPAEIAAALQAGNSHMQTPNRASPEAPAIAEAEAPAEDAAPQSAPRQANPREPAALEAVTPAASTTLASQRPLATRTQPDPEKPDEPLKPASAAPTPNVLAAPDQPLRAEGQAPASLRTEPAPERIDFATLVDTLARAREDASPRTVHASVAHAEFGRVSLRFDRDEDNALSVAMSSADPDFARAVSAAADASPASNESAAQAPRQQAAADARTSQGEGQRQQPQSQPAQQRPATNAAPRHDQNDEPTTRRDARDIYA
ncbi:hypothetical protein [Novosphingobium taihuense]|uniref:Flagellar hook-length control protein FliK n=1 Tax=Novosphingobium taihuense TaxID=260085 RepID=A0A7W7A7J7_9SPHN|nr:hypothetical protein [Novosphingobium taihuense]MBB4611831.1 hypothetical protein [Novosphingobium taihuense]TWH88814.1 hypothetical protein IQ25_00940 [Novosphingobium taihuense]